MSQKKFHNRGFSESIEETRAQRVGFKRYLRELEEKTLEGEVLEDDQVLPEADSEIDDLLDAFTATSVDDDLRADAQSGDADAGAELLMKELRHWLQHKGFSSSDVNDWMDKHDDKIFDFLYNGLT